MFIVAGAAFASSVAGGFSTCVAVLFHELPHEIGTLTFVDKPILRCVIYRKSAEKVLFRVNDAPMHSELLSYKAVSMCSGDFAVLLAAGMPTKQALFYNVISSVLCFVGLAIGLVVGQCHSLYARNTVTTSRIYVRSTLLSLKQC